ncbi:hypothetical protein BKA66DRAFT_456029 [Pyrenochaeta sp. MPI-SDFR-AT-0127]|nr:hypothetical protein BKA66DRAFT_456029 [Pyrenochaeta sp. MPI-SDFR-AT-0127]
MAYPFATFSTLLLTHLTPLAAAQTQPQLSKRDKSNLGFAYGLSTGVGIAGLLALVLIIWCLRARNKRRKAAGTVHETQEEAARWCTCEDCSGCPRKRGGGDGSQSCWKCRDGCGNV